MSVSTPQIIATIGSSIIFKFFQKPRGTPGDRSISIVMAIGGISTLVAAYLTSKIKDEVEIPEGLVEEGHAARRPRQSEEGSLIRNSSLGGLEY
jgi:solute carrier family 45 protein 1/2/4